MEKQNISDFLAWMKPHVGVDKGSAQWQYLLGTNGQLLTKELLYSKAKANYSKSDNAKVIAKLTPYIGKQYVTDCNGLAEWFLHEKLGGNFNTLSRYNYSDWCKGYNGTDMKKLPQVVGTAVFKYSVTTNIHHVGFLVEKCGAGQFDWWVAEAKGYKYGCVLTKLANDKNWNRWGLMKKYFNYDVPAGTFIIIPPTVRFGSKGANVKTLQIALNAKLKDTKLSVDGVFGALTLAAVKAYQTEKHLRVDGVVGRITWTSLLS